MSDFTITGATITGVHPYTFRWGKPALITGVKTMETPVFKRIVYETTFPDGFINYVPLQDIHNYRIDIL